jgi:hypothetical protein
MAMRQAGTPDWVFLARCQAGGAEISNIFA